MMFPIAVLFPAITVCAIFRLTAFCVPALAAVLVVRGAIWAMDKLIIMEDKIAKFRPVVVATRCSGRRGDY
jgi:hypothetical protein